MVREQTGDIVDTAYCRLFRFPDLQAFRRELMRLTNAKAINVKALADEVRCSHLDVEKKRYPPTELTVDVIP